ncbi:helix-turn-helix domain-containing protein, partial [Algoriphagus aestuarii]|nr:helix-turn-helix domain-containing protein [Algoriphagus aestuarii]
MSEQSTRTVERALALLSVVCEGERPTLAVAARAVELAPSTALRLLRTLEQAGFILKEDDGTYRAGPRLVQLGTHALS